MLNRDMSMRHAGVHMVSVNPTSSLDRKILGKSLDLLPIRNPDDGGVHGLKRQARQYPLIIPSSHWYTVSENASVGEAYVVGHSLDCITG